VIGQKINNYEVTALLGTGGMGAVYLARHPLIDRRVAVKILKPEYARDQVLVQRVFNEARATNSIRHPNIVDVLDVGVLPDGLPYIVMELLEGESLAHRIERLQRLSPSEAVLVAREAASALAAAHAKGIVHRDLKPDNVFLASDPDTGVRVKVLDFGIAKLRREMAAGSVETGAGSILGTPPYMSPEQCRGVSADVDHRADIYALGIILYEMLTGAPPFEAEGFGDVMMMHMSRPPRPPRELNPDIPPALEQLILTTLSKKREDRPQTMDELREKLGGLPRASSSALAPVTAPSWPGPVVATPPGSAVQTLPAVGRLGETMVLPPPVTSTPAQTRSRPTVMNRRTVTMLVGGGAGIGVLAGLLALFLRPAEVPPDEAPLPVRAARPEPTPEVTPEWPPIAPAPPPRAPAPAPAPVVKVARPPVRRIPPRRVPQARVQPPAPIEPIPVDPPRRMKKW
jgi:serine/threonine protein kinase